MLETETDFDQFAEVVDAAAGEDAAVEVEAGPLAPLRPLVAVRPRSAVDAPAGRRLGAALIDRLLPLPFLAAVFWPWALVVLAYDLLRDGQGASVGKRWLGLRTVIVSPDTALDGRACTPGRSLLRNLFWAGARLCYLSVFLSPVGFALDVTAGLLVWLSPGRGHLGDRLGGTRVVVADGTGGAR